MSSSGGVRRRKIRKTRKSSIGEREREERWKWESGGNQIRRGEDRDLAEVEEGRGQATRGTRDGSFPTECVHQGESGGRSGYQQVN